MALIDSIDFQQALEGFADCLAKGQVAYAVSYARLAQKRWDQAMLTKTLERARQHGVTWPIPGCPEADEAKGWEGWVL